MDNKPDVDEKKWRRLDTMIECILVIIASIIAQIIGTSWFDGSMMATIVVIIIAVFIFTCIKQFILSIIYNSDFLRKPFEKRDEQG